MDHNTAIGSRIKRLRTAKRSTLKQLSEETGLSAGFLSQLERGISNIAIDTLAKIADILGVPLSSFFETSEVKEQSPVMRQFEIIPNEISPQIYQYILSRNQDGFDLLPRIYLLMPFKDTDNQIEMYSHEGEEIIYVLEGVLTVYLDGNSYELYPGDSIHYLSTRQHNWINRTNRAVKIFAVNYPNPLKEFERK
jgi:transcriptional regulator with XRE-family HTH domain